MPDDARILPRPLRSAARWLRCAARSFVSLARSAGRPAGAAIARAARAAAAGLRTAVQPLAAVWWVRRVLLLLRRAGAEFLDDHCQQMAAAIAYHVLFSIFPLAVAAVGVASLVTHGNWASNTVATAVLKVVPLTTEGQQQLSGLLTSAGDKAGALGLLGLAGVLWSASGVMAAIRTALNVAWDTSDHRPFVRGKLVDLALVGFTFLISAVTLSTTVLVSLIRQGSGHLPSAIRGLAGAVTVTAAFLLVSALLFGISLFLYRVVPATRTRLREIWPGALAATIGFEVLQYGFAAYVTHFSHYDKIYGSIGAIIAFMFFVYLASWVFLFGAEVASEYPRLPAREKEKPGGTGRAGPGGAGTAEPGGAGTAEPGGAGTAEPGGTAGRGGTGGAPQADGPGAPRR